MSTPNKLEPDATLRWLTAAEYREETGRGLVVRLNDSTKGSPSPQKSGSRPAAFLTGPTPTKSN